MISAGHGQRGERRLVVVVAGRDDQGDEQRAEQRAGLVERLVDAEAPSVAHLLGGVGEHRVAGRIAGRLSDAFEDDQQRRDLPAAGEREQRHDRHLQDVAADRDRPVPAGPVRAPSREQPQAVPQQLAEAGDHADGQGAGAEQPQVLADDAPRALVGEVGEEAHHADDQHELHRRREPRGYAASVRVIAQVIRGAGSGRLHRTPRSGSSVRPEAISPKAVVRGASSRLTAR